MAARKPSVSRLLARRQAENDKLRAALEEMKAQRSALDARIREVEGLLGVAAAVVRRAEFQPGDTVRCADCGVHVPVPDDAGERGSECPACHASPFEASGVGMGAPI